MSQPFRFAIQDGPLADAGELPDYARMVEGLGYDELYSYDHVGNGAVDPFAPLVLIAASTTRLRVGTLVLNNEFHHPALLARTALSVDQMTSGRLVLGLGTGYAEAEHDAIGLVLRRPAERVSRLAESLAILRELLDTGACTFNGEHHTVAIEDLGLPAVQTRVPFLIGGHGRRVVTLAAQYADIFQFTGLTHGADGTPSGGGFAIEEVVVRADWLTDAAADRNDQIERSALVQFTSIGSDAPSSTDLAQRFGHDPDVLEDCPFVLSGSLEQIVDKIERTRQRTGISHYLVRDPRGFAPVVDALRGR